MATRMQQRRGTSEQWADVNPVLRPGELGWESDTNNVKIGDGVTPWLDLTYFNASNIDLSIYATEEYVDELVAALVPLPAQTDNAGKFLTTDGTAVTWEEIDALPDQTDQEGKFLTTDGTEASWTAIDAFPDQDSNAGKFLTTDGTSVSWELVEAALPDQEDQAGKILSTDGTEPVWVEVDDVLPTQSNNSGKFLTTNGAESSWATVDKFPTQTNNAGKALVTNGSEVEWVDLGIDEKQDKVENVSDEEIGYLNGVTSSIQEQLDEKISADALVEYATQEYVLGVVGEIGTNPDLSVDSYVTVNTGLFAGNGIPGDTEAQLLLLERDPADSNGTLRFALKNTSAELGLTIGDSIIIKEVFSPTEEIPFIVIDRIEDSPETGETTFVFEGYYQKNFSGIREYYDREVGNFWIRGQKVIDVVSINSNPILNQELLYLSGVNGNIQTQLNAKVSSSALQPYATREYVDTAISEISEPQNGVSTQVDAPEDPVEGQLWFNTELNRLFVYTVDDDSSQWVEASSALAGPKGDKGAKGDQGSTGASGLTWKGIWSNTATYALNDAVFHNSSSWFATSVPTVGTAPADGSTQWSPLALQGQQGVQGEKGEKGDAGDTGIVTAVAPLSYDSDLKEISIDLDDYATKDSPTFSGTVTFEEDTVFSGLPAPVSGSSVMTAVTLTTNGALPVTLTSFTLPEAGTYAVSYTARATGLVEDRSFGTYRVTNRTTPGLFVLNRQQGDLLVSNDSFISLQANKTYELRASLSVRAAFATFGFQTEAGADIGNYGGSFSTNSGDPGVSVPAYGVFTPTTNLRVRFVMHAAGSVTQTDVAFGEVSVKEITPARLGTNISFPLVRLQTAAGATVPNSELLLSSAGQSSSSATSLVTVTGETAYNLVGIGATGRTNTFLSDQNGRTRVSWFKLSANI